jgi:hypothetical protein
MIKLWNKLPHPKLFVYPWEPGYQADASAIVHKLSSAIANLLNITKPAVGAPLAATPPSRKHSAPWCYLVTKLPAEAMKTLIDRQCWSTPAITFFAIPFTPPITPYACTIENLTFVETDAGEALQTIKETIHDSESARDQVALHDPEPNLFQQILDTTCVKPLRLGIPNRGGGGTKLVWNVYINPPSQDPHKQREWRRILSSLTFLTALNGAGVAHSSTMHCLGCKSIDHPAGLCPIPTILGWHATPTIEPASIPTSLSQVLSATSTTPNTTTRGRGVRGRGNARNGRNRGRGARRGY